MTLFTVGTVIIYVVENNKILKQLCLKGGIVFYERRTQKVPCQDEQRSNMEVCFFTALS